MRPAQRRWPPRTRGRRRRPREADAARVGAVGALVDGHAPARVVLLGLADQRVLRLEQLVPDRDRLRGDAAEHAAHGDDAIAPAGGRIAARARLTRTWRMKELEPQANLVGAAAQAVRAGAAGGRGEEPPPRAPGGRDRLPARAAACGMVVSVMRSRHNLARVRGGRPGVAPRAGRSPPSRRRGGAGGAPAAAAARAARRRARWPCTGTATPTSWPRSAPRTCTRRAAWTRGGAGRAAAAGLDGERRDACALLGVRACGEVCRCARQARPQ